MLPFAVMSALSLAASLAALALVAMQGRKHRVALRQVAEEVATLRRQIASTPATSIEAAARSPIALRPDPQDDLSPGPVLIAVPDLAARGSDRRSPPRDDRHAEVWALADAGETPEAIAHATGQTVGRVELILALREPRGLHA